MSVLSKLALTGLFVSAIRSGLGLSSILLSAAAQSTDFDWESLTASASLNWTACYSGFQCTLLEVPLDYSSDVGNASIAIVRLPATAPPSSYLGPILFNPGGPGGSGVTTIVSLGASFADFLGPQFDIVGFDPRGVSFSKPAVSFFNTAAEREIFTPPDLNLRYLSLNASEDAIPNRWAQFNLVSQQAALQDAQTGGFFQYITTDNVARDMLRIVEAFGEEKLQYWGVSYGSLLGQTFATLFPDKVGRMAIDGIMDGEAWFSANLTGSMTDTDKTLETFYDSCFAAGPTGCAFYASSTSEIAANLNSLLTSLRAQPYPVLTTNPPSHGIVDFSWLRNAIFGSLYSPYETYVSFAQNLELLAAGNATPIYTTYASDEFECDCAADQAPFTSNIFESQIATACGDANAVNDDVAMIRAFYEQEAEVSSFADIWAYWRMWCSGWKIHREGRFQGPVGANTSFPLLIIGNTADPVTPHVWAEKAATLFPGSGLLTQDSPGHMSLVAPSLCTHGALRTYFVNGTLPPAGTVCSVEDALFPNATDTSNSTASAGTRRAYVGTQYTPEEATLLEAIRKIGDVVRPVAGMIAK